MINNWGVFASEDIKKGESICFLEGVEKSIPEIREEVINGDERVNDPLQVTENTYIDLEKPYVYFNHSCNPNAGMKGKNELFAIKDIKQDDEITFDYSTTSWEENWELPDEKEFAMSCECASKKCRKIIKDFSHLKDKLKRKYLELGALPDFIFLKLKNKSWK